MSSSEPINCLLDMSQTLNASLVLEEIWEGLLDLLLRYIAPQDARFQKATIVLLDRSQNQISQTIELKASGAIESHQDHRHFVGDDPLFAPFLEAEYQRAQLEPLHFTAGTVPQSPVLQTLPAHTSVWVYPLVHQRSWSGALLLFWNEDQHNESWLDENWLEQRDRLLRMLCVPLAVAVENARLYWQLQTQAGREVLINQLTKAIDSTLDFQTLQPIIQHALSSLGQVLGASRVWLNAPLEKGKRQIIAYEASSDTSLLDQDVDPFEPMAQAILTLRHNSFEPFVLNHFNDLPPVLQPWQALCEQHDIKSLVLIPLSLNTENSPGYLMTQQCHVARTWLDVDISLLQAMAEHFSLAFQQTMLFAEVMLQKQQLESTMLQLVQSEKMAVLGQFVAGIAHEVNTPLGIIRSNTSTLNSCLEKTNDSTSLERFKPVMSELIALNQTASDRIIDIVKNLRNFARLDESDLKTVPLHEGIQSTLQLLRASIDRDIQVTQQLDTTLPPVACYPGLLNQVFMNLIVNAMHAVQDNPPERPKSITITSWHQADKGQVAVSVCDTGKGIAAENLSKIFDPGFTTKGVGVGTGLGLALCYRIVEKHHGAITVDSQVNAGTCMTVWLPI